MGFNIDGLYVYNSNMENDRENEMVQQCAQCPAEPGPALKKDSFWVRIIKGFIIGVAGIVPGASGGVLAVSIGVYRPVLDAVNVFFKDIKRNFLFLLPLGIGGVVGLLSMSRVVEWLMLNYRVPFLYALIGMVLGGVPAFIKDANSEGFKPKYLLGTLFGAGVIALFALLEYLLVGGKGLAFNGWTAALSGGILAVGTVIPGVSTSFILMFMGLYEPLLSALNTFNIPMLLCVGVGAAAVVALLILFVKRMFDRHRGYAYYAVLGFLVGTIALIFPGVEWSWMQLLCVGLLAGGFAAGYYICKLSE